MGAWFSQFWPEKPNPSLVEIEARQRAEEAAEKARKDVEIAQANQEMQQKAMEAQQAAQAQAYQEMTAMLQAERAASEAAQAQAHKEMMEMIQAERAANEARLKAEIEAHASHEEAKQRAAEAEEERKRAAVIQEEIEKEYQDALERHTKKLKEAANEEKRKAEAASAQAQADKQMMEMIQAERAANEARLKAEIEAHASREEAKQRATEVEEERKRAVALQERIKEESQAAREHTKKMEEAAKEEMRKAEEAANASKKAAEEKLKEANVAREEAEGKLAQGIQPLVTPTPEEVSNTKSLAKYCKDLFHIAVAGTAGGGKSSLINAFRGLRNNDTGAAPTGVIETTTDIARCRDPNPDYPYVWYDVPGAGTLKIPDWLYFNSQGLYIYDCIIVLFNDRFTATEIAVLTNCRRFKIPTYIVRSKADSHIRDLMKDEGYNSDDDGGDKKKNLYQAASQKFIQQTQQNVKDNLENAKIPDQRVYIVSNETMLGVVKKERPRKVIDEIELLRDLIWAAQTRRLGRSEALVATSVKKMLQSIPSICANSGI